GARRRRGRDQSRPSHCHELSGHGTRRREAGEHRRSPHDRHQLSGVCRADERRRRQYRVCAMIAAAVTRPALVIAIDGPAASGKGTLARQLAAHYGLRHLDTGLSYRAVARELLAAGARLDDEQAAIAAAENLDL